MSLQAVPGVYSANQADVRRADLSSLTEEQRSAVAYMAQREAAALIGRALAGATERITEAVRSGTVQVPIFHLEDIARIEANWSSGKATHVTGAGS